MKLPAGTHKRKNGTLEKRFTLDGKRISVYGHSAAEIAEKEAAIRERGHMDNKTITLERYFEEWIAAKRPTVKAATIAVYKQLFRVYILPTLGKKKLSKIERRELLALRTKYAETLKASTVNQIFGLLKSIFKEAMIAEVIAKNPCDGIKGMKAPKDARETIHRALTEEEQRIFVEELKRGQNSAIICFMLLTGTRAGEAAALAWSDIDAKNGLIHIRRTTSNDENRKRTISETTKTEESRRDLPLTDAIRALFAEQRRQRLLLSLSGNNLVFPSPTGKPYTVQLLNYTIKSTLQRLERRGVIIERFSCHALRDTYATRYFERGGNPQTLKKLLGHTSYNMTMDLYCHVSAETIRKDAERVNIAL